MVNISLMQDWLCRINPFPGIAPAGFASRSLCGQMEPPEGWVEARRQIYDHELILIESGMFEIVIEETSYHCGANSFLIIPPGQWHTTRCLQSGKRHYAHFDWEYWPENVNRPVMTFAPARPHEAQMCLPPKAVPRGLLYGRISNAARIYVLANQLKSMLAVSYAQQHQIARAVLLELLLLLLTVPAQESPASPLREDLAHLVRMRLDAMEAGIQKADSVCSALTDMGYSYEHLARLFRCQYGVSPVGYLHGLRIEKAKTLLRYSNLKTAAVAESVGYQDSVYFTRLFKRHTGMTPARYRAEQLTGKSKNESGERVHPA